MQAPLVSVMMPAYNAEQFIGQAIESVLAQTYSNWELIVVNDGSTDRTEEVAAQYTDPRIRLIHQSNGGESAARNTAIAHMRGEFVAFLDADDLYLPQHLELTAGYLQKHPIVDGVYTDGNHCDENGEVLQTLSSRRRGPFEGWIFEEVVRASDVFGPPACVVIRHSIIARHNLRFDTSIVIGPDWDFFAHYCALAQFKYIEQRTCLYRVHRTNISIRTDLQRRALYLARCREKAIKINGFEGCSVETRTAVFFDLLVNLLLGYPERQSAITRWPEFQELPAQIQARLLRWIASRAIAKGVKGAHVRSWLGLSRKLDPGDWRSSLLSAFYGLSPSLCQVLLCARAPTRSQGLSLSPFSDLD